jgi:hypothetical protein
MGVEIGAANAATPGATMILKDASVPDSNSSMVGVLASVVVIALSLALLPMSAVTVIMAAMGGIWWLSSSSSSATVQMSAMPEPGSTVNGQASAAAAAGSATETQVGESSWCRFFKGNHTIMIRPLWQIELQLVHPCSAHSGVWLSNPCIVQLRDCVGLPVSSINVLQS